MFCGLCFKSPAPSLLSDMGRVIRRMQQAIWPLIDVVLYIISVLKRLNSSKIAVSLSFGMAISVRFT